LELGKFTSNIDELRGGNVFIVAVPTPVDDSKRPDFSPLEGASRTVGQVLNPGDHEHRLPTIVKVTSGSTPEC
jgi:UDP-N-acetyl-D-galactosamine dehydrogenase